MEKPLYSQVFFVLLHGDTMLKQVLVIENITAFYPYIQSRLQDRVGVFFAMNGSIALQLAKEKKFDAITISPYACGYAYEDIIVAKVLIKKLSEGFDGQLILATAREDLRAEFKETGYTDWCAKENVIEKILQTIGT